MYTSDPEVTNRFDAQRSMGFLMLINIKSQQFIMLINVKMPKIISMINTNYYSLKARTVFIFSFIFMISLCHAQIK